MTFNANAESYSDVEFYDDLEYRKVDDNEDGKYDDCVAISGCDKSALSVSIPAEIDGLPVTSIGYGAFSSCINLTSINIPDSVTFIGPWAFKECTSLESITIPDSVTHIYYNAFMNCTSLESITILNPDCKIDGYPDTISETTTIYGYTNSTAQAYAENYNRKFVSLDAPSTGKIDNFEYRKIDENNDGEYDYVEIYYCDKSAVSVDIPAVIEGLPVTSIRYNTFSDCESLESIKIPDSVISIGEGAFYNCTSLTSINIPDSVTTIGEQTFMNCQNLTSITIPDSVTSIGEWAFDSCTSLKSVTISESVTSIGEWAFDSCTSLKSVTIPESVTSIEFYAFNDCTSLESIKILNPDCKINGSSGTISETATIYGYTSSSAQAYAKEYNRKFVSLDNDPPEGNYYLGNVDGNTTINIFDAVIVAQYTVGKHPLTPEQLKAADIDHNNTVNIFDAVAIAKYTVGTPFPV